MMNKNLYKVDILKKIKEVQNIFYERNIDCSAVYNNERLVGALTLRDLVIADILRKNIKSDMFACRYAGDEFAILTSYNRDDCKLVSEKLISDIRKYKFPQNIPTSIAIGIADYDSKSSFNDNNTMDIIKNLINTASIASTKAKESNHNLVII
ncbi:diguanylate cyclase domain-containing protein [Clostridium beijerinckii]|uniref:GGDEF domain-containing protein n=1 Tax=Clostridium beijerinckii TaxID=1520 RepID=A0AAE5EX65_CLOBE|nr:diguanylate cyclase [Clostridium beijerinckii]NSB12309.1 GGDEF domain-containing protein [Clostridium beijerinckii]OOM30807.1 GGDEF domain protein [Clostridium beijerinckii]